MGTSSKAAERKVIIELTELLQKNESKVLSGETKLCLTTSSLSILATNFRRCSESSEGGVSSGRGRNRQDIDPQKWKDNLKILYDFVIKVKALKIIHGSYTMKSPVQIACFSCVQVLEVKKLPIHMVEGLSILRGQLKEITVIKSVENLQDLLEICGGDRSPGFVWSHLKHLYLSFNGLKQLHRSLRFVPFVEVMDLSHNSFNKTEDFLKCLTDIMRINLSYNMLTSVPQFSSSNYHKLKTLVLRSNQLDNLEGLEELVALEELDISNNFLIEHKLLSPLASLNRLTVLCVSGNPLCYKSNHRILTVQQISPRAGLGVFLLDGARLLPEEVAVLKQNQIKRYEAEDSTDGGSTGSAADGDIAVSGLKPGKRHQRKRSMERVPVIRDIENTDVEESLVKSEAESTSASFSDNSDFSQEVEKERNHYMRMRAHYKEGWLKALTVDQRKYQEDNMDKSTEQEENVNRDDSSKEMEKAQTVGEAEQRESQTDNETPKPATQTPAVVQPEIQPTQAMETTSPISPKEIRIVETTDIYSLQRKKSEPREEQGLTLQYSRMDSHDDVEDYSQYGEESEPFIVLLPTDDMKSQLITLNDRYLMEKDLNGHKLAALDLKCLLKVTHSEEKCYGTDIIGGLVFSVLTLDFDYVKKDRRQRKYALEDEKDVKLLQSMLLKHIKPKELEQDQWLECLKCHHEFRQPQFTDPSTIHRCPKCNSRMVITSERSTVPESLEPPQEDVADKEEMTRGNTDKDRNKSSIRRHSFSRRNIRRKTARESSPVAALCGQLKGMVDQLHPGENDKSATHGESKTQDTGIRSNTSWSDVHRAAGPRGSASSVESDIAILPSNSNRSNISVTISESSQERSGSGIGHFAAGYNISAIAETSDKLGQDVQQNGHLTSQDFQTTDQDGIQWVTDGKGQVTPVGSPLSNTVCSSMVSSVYENTLAGTGEESTFRQNGAGNQQRISNDSVETRISLRSDHDRSGGSDNRSFTIYEGLDVTGSGNRTSSSVDSVTMRKSSGRDLSGNRASNRNASMFGLNGNSDIDAKVPKERSIYDFPRTEQNSLSIYDTANSTQDLDLSRDDSADFHSHDSSLSLDVSPANQSDLLNISSPLRRNKHSRNSADKRSAIYSENISTEADESVNLPDFPDDLSPIKRSGSRRNRNAHGVLLDDSSERESVQNETENVTCDTESTSDIIGDKSEEKLLPWEVESTSSRKSGRDESLNHEEFVNIDHRIQLYLELKVLHAEEMAQCAIQCAIVQYGKQEEVNSLLVISTSRILLFQVTGESARADNSLKLYEDQPITELQYIDIGLGYQTLRLEFDKSGSSFTLLIADESRCKQFLTLITDKVQTAAVTEHSKLEGISKSNPRTLENLSTQVIHCMDIPDPEAEPQTLVKYLMLKLLSEESDTVAETKSLAITNTDLILVKENHQWPLPRLQPPLAEDLKGRQFTIVQREKINNIETVMYNEFNPRELRITFFETMETAESRSTWLIAMETVKGVKSLVDSIREPWEQEFGVSLDITSTSFNE